MIRNVATHTTDGNTRKNGRTHRALPHPLCHIGILQQGIGYDRHGKTSVPQNIEPSRALRPSAKQATGRKNAGKRQHPRDGDERSEKISTRDHEEGTRTQDGVLGEQQNGCDRVNDEHCRGISRDEGVDPRQLGGRERPGRDEKGDQQGQRNGKRKPSLRPTGRQA
jgi:hypothetical protein